MITPAAVRHRRILDLLAANEYVTVAEVRTATGQSGWSLRRYRREGRHDAKLL